MPRTKGDPTEQYERKKRVESARQRANSSAAADIGEIPPPEDPDRRAAAEKSLLAFCGYFPNRFFFEFSPDHLVAIAALEEMIDRGGLFALAMARGSGKTALGVVGVIWAVITGRHMFVALLGSTGSAAKDILSSIKSELENNDLLAADFPEVCVPIRELEGRTQRCKGQTCLGAPTMIQWKQDFIVLPAVAGSKASENRIKAVGLLGSFRGMNFTRSDGRVVRPSFVLPDDPQTDLSARKPGQCRNRLKVMNGAMLKLAAPGTKISAFCPCTVIVKGDLADQILDRETNPHWRGRRFKTLNAFPARLDLWQKYAIIRADDMRAGGDGAKAREFYAELKTDMDAGANVAWPQRLDEGDLSALETAMRLYFEDKYSFMAECQNEPIDEEVVDGELTTAEIVSRFIGRSRGAIPQWASKLTAFVDVQKSVVYWMVCAWRPEDFTGHVLDYGTWPDQDGREYYTLADAQRTLQLELPAGGLEAQITHGLKECTAKLTSRSWTREDGTAMSIDRGLIDAGFQTDPVYEFCRSTGGIWVPSHGRPIGPSATPMHEYKPKPGESLGFHVFTAAAATRRAIRHVLTDTYFWKSFIVARMRTPIGDPGALTLFGSNRKDDDHGMLADHLVAEKPDTVESKTKGRKVTIWTLRPSRPDNHFLDCLVGCYAAASLEGAKLVGTTGATPPRRQKSFADAAREQRAKMGRR